MSLNREGKEGRTTDNSSHAKIRVESLLTRAQEPVYFATTTTSSSRWAMFRDNAVQSRGSWPERGPVRGPQGPAGWGEAGRGWGVEIKEKNRSRSLASSRDGFYVANWRRARGPRQRSRRTAHKAANRMAAGNRKAFLPSPHARSAVPVATD